MKRPFDRPPQIPYRYAPFCFPGTKSSCFLVSLTALESRHMSPLPLTKRLTNGRSNWRIWPHPWLRRACRERRSGQATAHVAAPCGTTFGRHQFPTTQQHSDTAHVGSNALLISSAAHLNAHPQYRLGRTRSMPMSLSAYVTPKGSPGQALGKRHTAIAQRQSVWDSLGREEHRN